MIKSNLAAWTPAEPFPPYISVNYVESVEGAVEITVRERSKEKGILGDTVRVSLTEKEFIDLITELEKNVLAIRKRKNYGF
jgi:hypothetical protein